jgi:hypothetical protein
VGYIGTKPADAALTSADIADGVVTAAKLATDSVETAKVKDLNIATGKLAASAVTQSKTDFIATSSTAAVIAKGTSGDSDGYIQLNCAENSHGIKFKSPPHSASQSYTLTFPQTAPATDKFIQTNASGELSFVTIDTTDTHPTITSFTPAVIDATAGGTVTVTGTNFVSIPKVEMQNSSGALITAPTVSFTSATSISFTTGTTGLSNGSNVYIHITNPNGNGVRSATQLTMSAGPTWTTTSLANTESAAVISYNLDTDADSASTINPTPVSGALPSGTSISGTTNPTGTTYRAVLSGTMPTVSVETAYSFTLRVTDDEAQTADQAFTLTSTVGITGGGGFC